MVAMEVFDPPMCCSTGVCGPSVEPNLARFAADLDWLRRQRVKVERFTLSQRPDAFAQNAAVMKILSDGTLPAAAVNGRVVHTGSYPTRAQLARWAAVPLENAVSGKTSKLEECRAALSEGKLLLVAIPGSGGETSTAVRGAREFQASAALPPSVIVEFGEGDAGARAILEDVGTQAPAGGRS
ncbi:arsenite efflux transporter metallochaperone ArsD [Anaeromyxobacter sp. PSR-1]|uniref:arsenite efflux transporter metallochaperone ArsD n=1 Tax=Anaeromyxobacter sp. PSR-1 TaxID=1300915 RepID=UPI0005E14C9D|nr:arsenite efflux transporter metallochaperone ArsD [Anaeromyxobacter sp. PSR-1]GAO01264.1 arsenical resistance operon trans-acting repressor ArsD [Anaeromyxobacter sp. PSR-1]